MDVTDPLGLVGTVIDGKYKVEAVAGVGGTAVVYRAIHLAWHRRVALKVVRVLGEMSEEHRKLLFAQLTREAGLLASLSERTSAIVQARDLGFVTTAGGHWAPYLVLEWVEGVALDRVLETEASARMPLRTVGQAVRLLEPIALALELAHLHGIAHRDVKPANILVVGDARSSEVIIKILDFGIAKVVAEAHGRNGGFARTERAFTAFTPAYAAPEQFSRDFGSTGPWTDVFGLASVLFELATGRDAFHGADLIEIAAAVTSETDRPSLRGAGLDVSEEVEAVFARAVSVDPTKRQENAGQLWRELRAAMGAAAEEDRLSTMPNSTSLPPLSAEVPAGSSWSLPRLAVGPSVLADGVESTRTTPEPPPPPTPPPASVLLPFGRRRRAALALGALAAAAVIALVGGSLAAIASRSAPTVVASGAAAIAVSAAGSTATAVAPACPQGMILVPSGKFFMGSDDKVALDFEKPAHRVTVGAFCMDRTDLQALQRQRRMSARVCHQRLEGDRRGYAEDLRPALQHPRRRSR